VYVLPVHVRHPRLLQQPAERRTLNMEARALFDKLGGERARFVRMARSRVATEADAEDVVQRAMLRAAERAAQIADGAQARAWFYRILRRTIVDHHRSMRKEECCETPDELPAPEAERPRASACSCAERLIADLRPAYAEALRRVYYEGHDPAAIAADTGVTLASLYVRLHRARHALRERVQGYCGVSSIQPCQECHCNADARCGHE
jgi:RNA polymerase sigma-70 factor (ECF subfamily)